MHFLRFFFMCVCVRRGYVVFRILRLLFKPLIYNLFQRQNTLWTTSSKSCLPCISKVSSSCTSAFLFFRRDSTRARSLRRSSQHASCAVSFRRFPDDNGDCTCSTPSLGPTLQYEGTHVTYLLHLIPDMQSILQKNEARKSLVENTVTWQSLNKGSISSFLNQGDWPGRYSHCR